jgi:GH24 family phage-related lysozyme (muramidase)
MIRLPNIPNLQGSAISAPGVSAQSLAAPAAALQGVAKTIGEVGDAFHGVAIAAQKKENARLESEKLTEFAMGEADLENQLRNESDPDAIIQKTRAFYENAKGMMDSPDLPPAVRDALRERHRNAEVQGVINAGAGAAKLQDRRTLLTFQNEIQMHVQRGDTASANAAIDRISATGIILPEEAEKLRRETSANIMLHTAQVDMEKDAAGWIQANPKDKVPEGIDPLQWNRLHDQGQEKLRAQTYEDVQTASDAIVSGGITTPEQLQAMTGHLRPTVQAKLRTMMEERAQDGYRAKVSSPEYQQSVVGKVSSMLADYAPAEDDFDEKFVEMDSMVRSLPPGAIRDELTRRIDGVRTGKLGEIKDHKDAAMAALDEAHKNGRFGSIPDATQKIMPTQRAINDGFLRNPSKLQLLGFDEDQAEAIIGSKKDSDRDRAERFRVAWTQRKGTETATGIVKETAESILNGSTNIEANDEETQDAVISAKEKAERSYGAAKAKFADWIKANPDASKQEIDDKIFEYAGEETRKALRSGKFDPRPARGAGSGPKGADDSTSSVPVGKDLKTIVKHFEAGGAPGGFHRAAYWDFGQWSIGYGTKAKKGEVIDQAEAERRLESELAMHRTRVSNYAAKIGLELSPHELDALTSFDYNTGRIEQLTGGGTRSKAEIAEKMLLYRNADGQRLRGLERRREAERTLFLKGYA